jgi:quercetin dioxygenase-like cupin family protein
MKKMVSRSIVVITIFVIIALYSSTSLSQDESRKSVAMESSGFPAFIRSLPKAVPTTPLPPPPPNVVNKVRSWLLQGDPSGQVLFVESDIETTMPYHKHADQWGIVIDGKMDMIIDEQTKTYNRGDTYSISTGTLHKVRIYPGTRLVEFFADQERWKPGPVSK